MGNWNLAPATAVVYISVEQLPWALTPVVPFFTGSFGVSLAVLELCVDQDGLKHAEICCVLFAHRVTMYCCDWCNKELSDQ